MKKLLTLVLCLSLLMTTASFPAAIGEGEECATIHILCNNDYDANIKLADWEQYDSSTIFKDMLKAVGVEIELECIDRTALNNVVATRMAAAVDLPDLVAYLGATEDVLNWADSGLVIPASDLLDEYDPNGEIKAFYEERCPGAWSANTAPDGKIYWFSSLTNIGIHVQETDQEIHAYNPFSALLRHRWLEDLNIEYKDFYTPEELYDILVAFQENDANGNGLKDEVISIDISSFKNGMAVPFGLNQSLVVGLNGDGEVGCNVKNEHFKEYIEFMKSLVDAGLYDTTSLNDETFSIISNNRASMIYDGCNFGSYEKYLPNLDQFDRLYVPFILDLDGDYKTGFHAVGDALTSSSGCFFVTSACQNPEAIVKMMKVVYSNDYALLCDRGIEGVNYTLNEDGSATAIQIPDADKDPIKQTSLAGSGVALYALPCLRVSMRVQPFISRTPDQWAYRKHLFVSNFRTEYIQYGTWETHSIPQAIATEEELEVFDEYRTVLETYVTELLTDLILGRKSLDDLDAYIAEMESIGLNEFIEMTEARYNRYIGG